METIRQLKALWAYASWCAQAPAAAPACDSFWTWTAVAVVTAFALIGLYILRKMRRISLPSARKDDGSPKRRAWPTRLPCRDTGSTPRNSILTPHSKRASSDASDKRSTRKSRGGSAAGEQQDGKSQRTMKALVIREFGPPEVMRLEEVPTPVPEAGEVLVEVRAVSVNRTLDLVVRAGAYAVPVKLPHVLGVDPSGVVAAVGPGVTTRKRGDRVVTLQFVRPPAANSFPVILGLHVWGGYAQYVKVPVACTHPIPDGVDFPVATIVARHAPVAFSMLRDIAGLKSGDWVLVMGASGGLGSAGIQVAKYLG